MVVASLALRHWTGTATDLNGWLSRVFGHVTLVTDWTLGPGLFGFNGF